MIPMLSRYSLALGIAAAALRACGGAFDYGLRQILRMDGLAFAQDDRSFDGVGKLAHVARPAIAEKAGAGLGGESHHAPAELLSEQDGEVAGEEGDVLPALA